MCVTVHDLLNILINYACLTIADTQISGNQRSTKMTKVCVTGIFCKIGQP